MLKFCVILKVSSNKDHRVIIIFLFRRIISRKLDYSHLKRFSNCGQKLPLSVCLYYAGGPSLCKVMPNNTFFSWFLPFFCPLRTQLSSERLGSLLWILKWQLQFGLKIFSFWFLKILVADHTYFIYQSERLNASRILLRKIYIGWLTVKKKLF